MLTIFSIRCQSHSSCPALRAAGGVPIFQLWDSALATLSGTLGYGLITHAHKQIA